MEANKYKNTAHLYDLDPRPIIKDDLPFYLDLASKYGGNDILEAACGTGRVCIPLARAGFNVTGFDLSRNMIHVLKKKLLNEETATRARLHIFVADMTKYKENKKYSLIIVPFRAFQLLTEKSQQQQFLMSVKELLDDNGVFVMNTYRPYGVLDETWVQREKEDWVVTDAAKIVRRTHIRKSIDVENQMTYIQQIYYVENSDGSVNKYVEDLAMKYYYEDQLRELLLNTGFQIQEEYGYYDYRSISKGPEMIFVCKP